MSSPLTNSEHAAVLMQQGVAGMGYLRQSWSEDDVLGLPEGEHDFFERKSGQLLSEEHWREVLSKSLSAFANSGGGHIIVGQKNDCQIDGVDPLRERTAITDWLEQIIPTLVTYPLKAFRVHTVQRRANVSKIPPDKVLVVIDIGDSSLAPHQTTIPRDRPNYYYRAGSHSVVAPHHYLEALRTRFVGAQLTATCLGLDGIKVIRVRDRPYWQTDLLAEIGLRFTIENKSRQACYKWLLDWELTAIPQYVRILGPEEFPSSYPSIRETQEIAILPSRQITRAISFGALVPTSDPISSLARPILGMGIHYRAISEHFVPEFFGGSIGGVVDNWQLSQGLDDARRMFNE